MPTPTVRYQKGFTETGWTTSLVGTSGNSLVLPDTLMKARRKEVEEEQRRKRGMFFSDWSRSPMGANTTQSLSRSTRRVNHDILQFISRQCVLDQAIFQTIIATVQRFCKISYIEGKQLGYRVQHRMHRDPNWKPEQHELDRINGECREMERLILKANPDVDQNLSFYISASLDNELSIDRKVMVKRLDSRGKPIGFHWIPGETIQPTYSYIKPFMEEWGKDDPTMLNPRRAAERQSYYLYRNGVRAMNGDRIDLTNSKYVQIIEGDRIVGAWKADEMYVDIVRPYAAMDETMYGFSPLEQSLGVSRMWMQAWDYQGQLFNTSWPEAILILRGDYDAEGLEAFKQSVLADNGNSLRLPVVAAGAQQDGMDAQLMELRKTPTEMMFADLLNFIINLKCGYFGIRPSSINFPSANADPTAAQELNYTIPEVNDTGIRGRMEHFAHLITEEIIYPHYPYLEMVWDGMDMVPTDVLVQRELGLMQVKTLNETRTSLGLPVIEPKIPSETDPGMWVLNPNFVQVIGQMMAMKAQESQSAPQNPSELSQPAGQGGGDFGGGGQLPNAAQPAQPADPSKAPPPAQGPEPVKPIPPQTAPAPGGQ